MALHRPARLLLGTPGGTAPEAPHVRRAGPGARSAALDVHRGLFGSAQRLLWLAVWPLADDRLGSGAYPVDEPLGVRA